ncbi:MULTISPECIES: bifunctional DNA primase/polymerase [unclassified Streptomyces]|uniref:bifunctional DNA primase/polymerase n=1 Tax=unclassified Streptomyces TaxID=2593676 RepID=UPI001BEC4E92|nr:MULTISPECIES: bifunctional DNA primase/polymerase [unclassified Streptomyces]MBT2402817.1 bifunctional DNA primase/polymerase [Streptomyces sp. ISL-21]MBT2454040.1 bifunctional DNA primase/polymerase [Streptomyces sp. ISL-86]MBT2607225.1 bifunctional DNA primase/polymerase [Streptomyces sp. ISL-87]
MREILGRRLQRLRNRLHSLRSASAPASGSPSAQGGIPTRTSTLTPTLLDTALTCATVWHWPVLPGVGRAGGAGTGTGTAKRAAKGAGKGPGKGAAADGVRCACPDPDCVVPGAHPFDPGLLAATTDARMVAWWWARRPSAPVLLATGGAAPCAVSLPAKAAARAVVRLDAQGMRLGPIVATPTRWSLLVAPYSLERLGELLYAKAQVPSSLRFHGEGGYLLLPPSAASGGGQVRWEREPGGAGIPWLPEVEAVVDALVEASSGAPGGGSRLAY